uniref:Uncharacterized protein n=1 Tax=Anguilla anguilla TaxID=7936 RepID=A0A0E9X6X2_ANGAN
MKGICRVRCSRELCLPAGSGFCRAVAMLLWLSLIKGTELGRVFSSCFLSAGGQTDTMLISNHHLKMLQHSVVGQRL